MTAPLNCERLIIPVLLAAFQVGVVMPASARHALITGAADRDTRDTQEGPELGDGCLGPQRWPGRCRSKNLVLARGLLAGF